MLPVLVLKEKDAARLHGSVPAVWGKVRGVLGINSIPRWPARLAWASLASAEQSFSPFLSLEAERLPNSL